MSVKKLFDLSGRVAIVTGGSRGLGLQIAEALGEMGAKLALTARKKDELDGAVAHLAKHGIEARAWVCDIGKREAIPGGVRPDPEAASGRVDILVNNAGAVWAAPAEDHPLEAWDKLVNLNLIGGFVMAQQAATKADDPGEVGPHRQRRLDRRADGERPGRGEARSPTTPPSTAVVGMTKQLAAEWGRHGITVNAICPGFFPSTMTQRRCSAPPASWC